MAKEFRFYAIRDANADIQNTSDAINALLTAAKVTTIEVNGKQLPATSDEVPNALKIAAYAATVQPGTADAQLSTALANNTILADQARSLEQRAVLAETSNATLNAETRDLKSKLEVANANIATLTASTAELTNLRKAANDEAARVTGQYNALNSELSRRCLAVGCLTDLRNEKNELLPSTANADEKQAAADRIKPEDKLNSLLAFKDGQVNRTLAQLGVSVTSLPAAAPSTATATEKPKSDLKGIAKTTAAFAQQAERLLGRKVKN